VLSGLTESERPGHNQAFICHLQRLTFSHLSSFPLCHLRHGTAQESFFFTMNSTCVKERLITRDEHAAFEHCRKLFCTFVRVGRVWQGFLMIITNLVRLVPCACSDAPRPLDGESRSLVKYPTCSTVNRWSLFWLRPAFAPRTKLSK
jgi:hypothetical protein